MVRVRVRVRVRVIVRVRVRVRDRVTNQPFGLINIASMLSMMLYVDLSPMFFKYPTWPFNSIG